MIQNILEYSYINAGAHAVTGLTNTTGTLLPAFDQTVDYTAFNKASYISQGDYSYYLTYGPDRQRSKTVLNHTPLENTILTKYYAFGDYEKEVTPTGTRHLHYIAGGDGLAAIYAKYDNAPDSLYFIMKDHLGSIVGAINDETGTVYRQNFDAWGRKRNPVTWSYTDIPDFPFDRGYTGHEHLKWFGLINMNGRLYDAALGRFLSPDLIVQNPTNTQNYNRYSYCLNNPLKYVDPSGYYRAGNSGDWWAGGDGPVFYFQGYGQEIPSGIGPGSGNHWSDYTRSEFGNFMLSNRRSFDYMYGPGSVDLGYEMYKNPILREQWASEEINLAQVRKDGGYWVYVSNDNVVGENMLYGTNSQLNELSGSETILKFIKIECGNSQAGVGEPLPTWLSWTNNSINTVAYGATVTGGSAGMLSSGAIRYYFNAWKGNQYIKTFSLTKLGTNIGYGTSFVGFGIGLYNFFDTESKTWGTYGQLGISLLSSGLTLSGPTSPIGIGIGFIEVAGGFSGFYNYLDSQQQFYNSTGGMLLPVNGIPTFIPIRKP